ncbi:MAG: serine/threonine-protein kinase [Gemmatimonadales bacterium]
MTDGQPQPLAQRLSKALGATYTVEGEIGRGGMGVVYRARDERLQRRVAIKVLPPELAFQDDIRARFMREAQTAARLSHPNIVPIHDVGASDDITYFTMGYVDGESLGGRIKRRGQLPVEDVRRIMKETADALSAAHAMSVIHRDIKPDNILLDGTRARVMVTDFGIAKALSGGTGATLTSAGVAIGTPSYMSPEQAAGEKEIDGRSDLYSLGIVAYQMLTGELPFTAPTVAGILMKQITEPAPMVTDIRPDVPEDLALAVARCLEKDPENRWPTADALRRSLESRVTGNYRPTGTGFHATARPQPNRPGTGARRPLTNSPRGTAGMARSDIPRSPRGSQLPVRADVRAREHRLDRWGYEDDRGRERDKGLIRDTGEPEIVQRVRQKFAKWASLTGGLLLINIATGINHPWFLFGGIWYGWSLISDYGKLWHAGYSWRDVLHRPPAPDAIEARGTLAAGGKLPRQLAAPSPAEFGTRWARMQQAHGDRAAVFKLLDRLAPAEREMLPDVVETINGLYGRAQELGRTLQAMDTGFAPGDRTRIESRIAVLQKEPAGEEHDRQLALLERQKSALGDIEGRRVEIEGHFESCVLAIQNVRYDLLRLRQAGLDAVVNDLTQATQAARVLSRDVDAAIAAAGELREAMK